MTTTNNILLAVASINIEARGDSSKPVRVAIAAYNGGLMQPPGWPQLAIELSGVTFPGSVPLLADHQSVLAGIVGHGSANVRDGKLLIEGTLSDATESGRQIIALAKSGFPFQASIGLKTTERVHVRAGESAIVNGQSIKSPEGGFIHVLAGVLQEVSILPLGADSSTSVSVAATKGVAAMSDETQEQLTPEQVERERVAAIMRASAQYAHAESTGTIAAQAVEEGWDVNKAELQMLLASRPVGPPNIAMNRSRGGNGGPQLLEASLMLRSGHESLAVTTYGPQVVEAAARSGINSQLDLMKASIRAEGREVPSSVDGIIKAAFSTASFPNILSNVMGKSLAEAYSEQTEDIFKIATVKSASSFHEQKTIRPSSIETTEEVGPAGEIKHSDLKEEDTYAWQLATFSRMVGITRTDIVNDDLSFFDELPGMLAVASARKLLDLFWSVVMAGESAGHYSSGNGNFLEAGSDLDITSLGLAISTFRSQRDSRGNNINVRPRAIAVPPELETVARPLLNSSEIVTGSDVTKPSGNPVQGVLDNLLVEARLSNTDKFTGAATAAWYVFGSPMSHGVLVGFLNGRRVPIVEISDAPFDVLGVQMRVYHDFAAALGDPKASLKATGASAG